MRIGILGTGTLARGLALAWKNHDLVIAGRSATKAQTLADEVGATAASPRAAVTGADAVLLAVAWEGVEDVLRLAAPPAGTVLIDPVNAVEHGIGVLLPETSAAQRIATLAPGTHVVKAFHLFPAAQWTSGTRVTVPVCGDDPGALAVVGELVRDAGAEPATVGGLDRARQLEEVAGFVIGLAFAGVDPQSAIPSVPA
jgi:8-hydroxy-5-deazaflavin:NADPH oxidoreductase